MQKKINIVAQKMAKRLAQTELRSNGGWKLWILLILVGFIFGFSTRFIKF